MQGWAGAPQDWNSVTPWGTPLFPHPAGHGLEDPIPCTQDLREMGGGLLPGVGLRNVGHPTHWLGALRCSGWALLPTLLGHPAPPPWPDWFGSPIQSRHPRWMGDGLFPAHQSQPLSLWAVI